MNLLIGIAVFITLVLLIEGTYFLLRSLFNPERRRLRSLSAKSHRRPEVDIVRQYTFSEIPWLHAFLFNIPAMHRLARLMEQGNVTTPLGIFLLLAMVLVGGGLLLAVWMTRSLFIAAFSGMGAGLLPFAYLIMKKTIRANKFQRQRPEGLDMLTRALRAGHGFMIGMKMIGDEFPDPIGPEFGRAVDEINFGVAAPVALEHLTQRINCQELNFFVTSVIVQRETGGDLSEVIENIAQLIRKRFELQGRIRALSAEGKMSAIVLIALPISIFLIISILSPDYLLPLYTDPFGRTMVMFAALMMLLGIVTINKMIKIKI
ncbi:MAG: type II secretion system F family protein [bacterium]|nr:type II secretion system F family protein [bacterium]